MNTRLRATIAHVVARLSLGEARKSVYDYSQSKYVSFGGTVTTQQINVFDYDRQCYLTGQFSQGRYQLFDYEGKRHVQLEIAASAFKGFDYGSGRHFQGRVDRNTIQIFNYETGSYFNYQV